MSMASSTSGSSSSTPPLDDDLDDACSICLESFSLHDPSTATTCKHEYHLHCILEWSQRSRECPICWQSLSLKDPASQELLAAVEMEKSARQRHVAATGPSYMHHYQEFDSENGSQWTDDQDFSERIMRRLAAMSSRARQTHRNESWGASPVLLFPTDVSNSTVHPNTPEEWSSAYGSSGHSSPTSSISSRTSIDAQPPLSPLPSFLNLSSGSAPNRDILYNSRRLQNQSPDCLQRPRPSELLAFSESIKSRVSAASARYKDSISKGTQGFREKFLARNNSVKEISKGVQREMSASIAGVARMIERLELKSKRNSHGGENSNLFSKGKGVLDNILANSCENCGVIEQGLKSHEQSQATSSISSSRDVLGAERGN